MNFVAKLLFRPQSCRDIRIAIQDWNHFNVMYATSRFLNQSTSKLISKRIIQRPLRWRLKVAKLSKFIENKCCVVIFSFIYYFLLETLNAYWDLLKKVKSFFWTNEKKIRSQVNCKLGIQFSYQKQISFKKLEQCWDITYFRRGNWTEQKCSGKGYQLWVELLWFSNFNKT